MKEEEWQEWKVHPGTKEFFEHLKEVREGLREGWSRGQFTGETGDKTLQMNAEAIGRVAMIDYLIDLDWRDFDGEA